MKKQDLELSIIEAKQKHIKEIFDLYNYYITNSTATFDLEEISLDTFLKRIKIGDSKSKTYILNTKDTMIGFCFYNPYRENPAYRETVEIGVYIKPEYTGKRYGEQMVHHLEQVIKENKYRNIIASICSDNTCSIRLFKRLGYTQCADYKEIAYKHDHYVGIVDFQKIFTSK